MAKERILQKKSNAAGRNSTLAHMGKDRVSWMKAQREEGLPLTYEQCALQVDRLDPSFANFGRIQLMKRAGSLTRSSGFTIRVKTHEAQKKPRETEDQAKTFIQEANMTIVSTPGLNKLVIVNMDETPVYGCPNTNRTLSEMGAATVTIRTFYMGLQDAPLHWVSVLMAPKSSLW